jgi:SAM-dependent methyltransferase
MRRAEDLFELSIPDAGKYAGLLEKKPEYEELVTFAENKTEPVYNWFYYKEGFSKTLVTDLLKELRVPAGALVLDPFCGAGTTLLAAKQMGYSAIGFDILPIGVFVANTKLQEGYDLDALAQKIRDITVLKFGTASTKWADPGFIDMRKAFSRYARNDILFFREKILAVEDDRMRNFLMLGLLSIVSEASNTKKDGGVIKIVQKRHLPPVRYLLKNRLKRMFKDLKNVQPTGIFAEAHIGDARDLPLENESIGACITSPPYLNYIDYTKLYGLELSLLLSGTKELIDLRKRSLRSHVGAEYKKEGGIKSENFKETLEKVKEVTITSSRFPEVLTGYFEDMYIHLENLHPKMKTGGYACYVVGNTCLPGLTVDVDLILAELGEQAGFTAEKILVAKARWCDVGGIRKERPVRESVVILKK